MQRRPRQMRNGQLESLEAIIQRQQRVLPECDEHCPLRFGENGRTRLLRPGLQVFDRRTLAPLRDGFGVDAQFNAQLRERSLRSLYCCSDGVRTLLADLPCKSPAG